MNSSVFDILRRPVITEKSNYQATKLHQYVFEVASFATRDQVKSAVETAFDVDVVRVNIINLPAKSGRKFPHPRFGRARLWLQKSHRHAETGR